MDQLVAELEARFEAAGFLDALSASAEVHASSSPGIAVKSAIRELHRPQRIERANTALPFLRASLDALMPYFADGRDVNPAEIVPRVELVHAKTREAELFRLASLTWSVPVSEGYGRRMRFLIWDESNGKIIGIFALGDPVFNLAARDREIGWSASERAEKLVNVMDAYVLGAVPPYSQLLGGKLVAALIRTREIKEHFDRKYGFAKGIISGRAKNPKLLAVTTTSSLGRSSVYNRLTLAGRKYLAPIGFTSGFGHFHVSAELFDTLRRYLVAINHPYAADNRFGQGPNWKFRTIRAAFENLGISRDVLQHGIQREVFLCELASNCRAVLTGAQNAPDYSDLLSVEQVSRLAIDRWMIPRGLRRPEFRDWRAEQLLDHSHALGLADPPT